MKPSFQVSCLYGTKINYTRSQFAAGEEHVKLGKLPVGDNLGTIRIKGLIKSSSAFMELILLRASFDECGKVIESYELDISYMPYSRQDRICNPGEAFSLEVSLFMLHQLNFEKIYVDDLHSHVDIYDYVPEIRETQQWEILSPHLPEIDDLLLVAPDKGAKPKVEILHNISQVPMIQANKNRDPETGNITSTSINDSDIVIGKTCLIVDDIGDGMRTFVPLVELLKKNGADEVYIYVTHAVLPYGIDHVVEVGLDGLFYKNLFDESLRGHPEIFHVSDMSEVMENE